MPTEDEAQPAPDPKTTTPQETIDKMRAEYRARSPLHKVMAAQKARKLPPRAAGR